LSRQRVALRWIRFRIRSRSGIANLRQIFRTSRGNAALSHHAHAGCTISWCLALLLFASGAARADDWSTVDTARQAMLTTLLVVDWGQTRWMVKHPRSDQVCTSADATTTCTSQRLHERNPLLGEHPSIGKVNNLIGASIIAHAAIAYMLPRGWREGWQYVWIGVEAGAVYSNHCLGIKLKF
jgi:hypothetical protein